MSSYEREQLSNEYLILSSLKHPNIVKFYHKEELEKETHLYMEYCENGDLSNFIKRLESKEQYADEEFVWRIFYQLTLALYRCHYGADHPGIKGNTTDLNISSESHRGVILHRDLKPENVFLGKDNIVKLGDFGLSKMIQNQDFASTLAGTPFYMSPEICSGKSYSSKSDIWSLGCVIYELCSREPPFKAESLDDLTQNIIKGKIKSLSDNYSERLKSVVTNCINIDPEKRPNAAALLSLIQSKNRHPAS